MQDHLPVIYTVVQSRGVAMQFSGGTSHAESSAILQAEGFLLYLYGPLTVTLLRVCHHIRVGCVVFPCLEGRIHTV